MRYFTLAGVTLSLLGSLFVPPVLADSVDVGRASWDNENRRLRVRADGNVDNPGGRDITVRVFNAGTGALITSRTVELHDDGDWEFSRRARLARDGVPCRVRVEAGNAADERDVRRAPDNCVDGGVPNQAPTANAGPDQAVTLGVGQVQVAVTLIGSGSSDPDGQVQQYLWSGQPDPADVVAPEVILTEGQYSFSLTVIDDQGLASQADTVSVTVRAADNPPPPPPPPAGDVSINSTSANGALPANPPVFEQPFVNDGNHALLAANDLGMHCADLDYRVFSILPPFNVVHAQVIRRGGEPTLLDDTAVEVIYSAASNPNDPALGQPSVQNGFKGNFWEDTDGDGESLGYETYAPLFFGILQPGDVAQADVGVPVFDSILLRGCLEGYLNGTQGPEGPRANCGVAQAKMPGVNGAYILNEPQHFDRFDRDINFFNELLGGLGIGGIITDVNWFAVDGVPIMPVDDQGRRNAYPLMRVQARDPASGDILASTDIVLPVASEADCQGCHAPPIDCATTTAETGFDFACNGLALERTAFTVMTLDGDGAGGSAPGDTALEQLSNVAKINILRLHDAKHGTSLDASRPVQCATCHYTPALDLAQLGPTDSPGTDQTGHITMSRAMHGHHGELLDDNGRLLFPDMPSPVGRDPLLAQEVLGETCYQCHPGKRTQCLRGAMAAGGVVCQDCHGDSRHVGNDFSESMRPDNRWPEAANLNKRVPWAVEPGCQSCHTGDAVNSLAGAVDVPVADDGIRLLQAYTLVGGLDAAGAPDGTELAQPIVASNKRFAEDQVLYRLSKGHGGVMCEGCHGSTHAIFPNPNPDANDNVASNQLQGHAGTIIECSTCHGNADLGNTLDGPHGMHPVGRTGFADGGHENLAERNPNACRACHGRNGEGTVLSLTATDRDFRGMEDGGQVPAGTPVSCSMCHENEL